MINILLSGACGKMGNAVARCALEDNDLKISAGVDRAEMLCDFPVYKSFDDVKPKNVMWTLRAALTGRLKGADLSKIS